MRRVKALTERFRPTSSSDVNTLEMLLNDRRVHFPCVVSMSTGNGDVQEDSGQMVLLEDSVRRIKFVRLEVVDGAIGPDGEIDRSLEWRKTLVGQEMLIPLTFDCNVTTLNKAYARKLIKEYDEMLLCRYSHVYATNGLRLPLANCSTGFSSPCYVPIPDGTRLEVTYVKNSTEVNMFATDSNNVYYKITEENVHKLEAKNTKSTMSLQELVVSSQLPRAVQFQQIEESDIATSDMGCRNKIVKYLRGLVKVKRVEEYELIVAWRHKGISHKYSIDVMLIPNEMAKNLVVKPYCFKTTESSKAFIAKHFDNCSWDNCVGKQLYEYQRTDSEVSIIGVLNVTVSSSNVNKYTGMLSREEQAKNRDLAQRNKDDNRNAKDQVRRQEIPKMSDERAEGCAKYTCNSSDEGIGVRFDLAETSLNDYEEIGEYVVLKNDKEMVIHKQEREHEANAIIDEDESNLYDEISI